MTLWDKAAEWVSYDLDAPIGKHGTNFARYGKTLRRMGNFVEATTRGQWTVICLVFFVMPTSALTIGVMALIGR